jgi:hypothetical protein
MTMMQMMIIKILLERTWKGQRENFMDSVEPQSAAEHVTNYGLFSCFSTKNL